MSYFQNLASAYQGDLTPFLRQGQVKRVHFVDEATNISKVHPEYDVLMFDNKGSQTLLRNVRSLNLFSSLNDHEETIIEPTEVATSGELDDSNTPENRNGSYVLIGFLNGDFNNPIIVGGLDHPGNKENQTLATKEKGIHKFSVYRGLRQEINKDGELEFTFTGAKGPDGTPNNEDQTPITFKLGRDGSITSGTGHRFVFTSGDDGDRLLIRTNQDQIFQIEDTEGAEAITLIQKQGTIMTMNNAGSVQVIGSNGSYLFLNSESDETSLVQKDGNMLSMTPDEITIAHKAGTDIISITEGKMQFTTGGTLSFQPAAFGISAGTIDLKDQLLAGLKIENGLVALGGPAAELLDLFDQTLQQLDTLLTSLATETHTGNLGYPTSPPLNAASYIAVQVQLAIIKGLLATFKGTL